MSREISRDGMWHIDDLPSDLLDGFHFDADAMTLTILDKPTTTKLTYDVDRSIPDEIVDAINNICEIKEDEWMDIARFHQGRIGNPTSDEHLQKWVDNIHRLPDRQIRAIIEEYELGKANE